MSYETPEERDDREAAERRSTAQAYWAKKAADVVKSRDVDNKDVVIDAHIEPGTCPCGACPINEYGRCATCEDERAAAGQCPHGIDRIGRYCEVCDAAMDCPDPQAQIDELRECLILAVKELDSVPPVSIYTKSVCTRSRKALGL